MPFIYTFRRGRGGVAVRPLKNMGRLVRDTEGNAQVFRTLSWSAADKEAQDPSQQLRLVEQQGFRSSRASGGNRTIFVISFVSSMCWLPLGPIMPREFVYRTPGPWIWLSRTKRILKDWLWVCSHAHDRWRGRRNSWPCATLDWHQRYESGSFSR